MLPDWGTVISRNRIDTEKYFGVKAPASRNSIFPTSASAIPVQIEVDQSFPFQSSQGGERSLANNTNSIQSRPTSLVNEARNQDSILRPDLPFPNSTSNGTSSIDVAHAGQPDVRTHSEPNLSQVTHSDVNNINSAPIHNRPGVEATYVNTSIEKSSVKTTDTESSVVQSRRSRSSQREEQGNIKDQIARQRSRTSSRRRESLTSSQQPPATSGNAASNKNCD